MPGLTLGLRAGRTLGRPSAERRAQAPDVRLPTRPPGLSEVTGKVLEVVMAELPVPGWCAVGAARMADSRPRTPASPILPRPQVRMRDTAGTSQRGLCSAGQAWPARNCTDRRGRAPSASR
jgi:hypothetical protein